MVSQLTLEEVVELLKTPSNLNDIILNLLLFVPFGFGLAELLEYNKLRSFQSLLLTLITSLGLSLTVEILQFFLPGRTSTSIDLFTNTLSGIGGAVLFIAFLNWVKYSSNSPRRDPSYSGESSCSCLDYNPSILSCRSIKSQRGNFS